MKSIIYNGLFLSDAETITGIERVCIELVKNLDILIDGENIKIYYAYRPNGVNKFINPHSFKNIIPLQINKRDRLLDNTRSIRKELKDKNAILVNLALDRVYVFKQLFFLYDLRPLEMNYDTPAFVKSYKKLLSRVKPFVGIFLTDSFYQKDAIARRLHIPEKRIDVIYMGHEHIMSIKSDYRIFDKFPKIKDKPYFYALGSVAPHKNYKWIMEVAKRNPNSLFAIAGGKNLQTWKDETVNPEELKNVVYLGYVSDEESKALMEKCKGFLHPSYYEGFGIPPLEALACGAKIAISNRTCLPEVYEDSAIYFDPDNYDIDIEELFKQEVASPKKILEKCSWEEASKKLLSIFKRVCE